MSLSAYADCPVESGGSSTIAEQDGLGLELEEILSDKGALRFEFGTAYTTTRQSKATGVYQFIHVGDGEFISVPTEIGTNERQADIFLATLGLRYGLTTKAEIFARSSFRHDRLRYLTPESLLVAETSGTSLHNLVVGLNYRLKDDGKFPGIVAFTDISVLENINPAAKDFGYAKAATVGFTTYKVIDPVVLSLTAGYRANFTRQMGERSVDPGDLFFLNPGIGFAVNNELTLNGGFSLQFFGADKLDGQKTGRWQTQAELEFGTAYAVSKDLTLRADTRTQILGDRSFTAGLTATYKFNHLSNR